MTYPDATAYLDSLAQFGWKLDLARIRRLCVLAGHPEARFTSVLVGGSAGKGSTSALLASILQAAGVRVGTAPKPHLVSHCERAQVDGRLIGEESFGRLMGRVRPLAEQVTAEQVMAESGSPTVFEVLTLLAFLHFAEQRVGRAVMEVGLGGRFDATNVLEPDLSVITTIGLDHTDRLGDTVEKIAFEKAGIIKRGARLVTGAEGGALRVIEDVARERGAAVWRLGREIVLENVHPRLSETRFDLATPAGSYPDLRVPLAGEHQAFNGALAAAAAVWLRDEHPEIDESAVRQGLERAFIAGRLQVVRSRPRVVLDAAHSPDRADALLRALHGIHLPSLPGGRLLLVIGCSRGHAPAEVVGRLAGPADVVIATRSRHAAAIPAEEIADEARRAGSEVAVVEPVPDAVRAALEQARPEDMVLVTGSIFVVGEALAALSATEPAQRPRTGGCRPPRAPPSP